MRVSEATNEYRLRTLISEFWRLFQAAAKVSFIATILASLFLWAKLDAKRPARPANTVSTKMPCDASPVIVRKGGSRKLLIASEGDSISIFWGGNHTGVFAKAHPGIEFHSFATSGGTLIRLIDRADTIIALHPDLLTVVIGANDLHTYPSGKAFAEALAKYAARIRMAGIKIVVATIMPRYDIKNPSFNKMFNDKRHNANAEIRARVGPDFDGVIDLASDSVIGTDEAATDKTLFYDGLHPTNACGPDCGGQGKMARIYTQSVDSIIRGDCPKSPS